MRDTGDVMSGWVIKLLVVFALVGVVAYDGIHIMMAQLGVADDGWQAAQEARQVWSGRPDVQVAYDAAAALAVAENADNTIAPESFRVGPDGSVTLTMQRTATTLVVGRIPAIEDWAARSSTETSTRPK